MYRPSFPKALSKYYFSHIYICSWTRKTRNYLLIHRHFSLSTLTTELFSEEIKRGHRLITLGSTKHTILESLIIHKDCSYNLWRPAFVHNLLPLLFGFWHKLTLCLQRELKASPTSNPGEKELTELKMNSTDAFGIWGRSRHSGKCFPRRRRLALLSSRYVLFGISSLGLSCGRVYLLFVLLFYQNCYQVAGELR